MSADDLMCLKHQSENNVHSISQPQLEMDYLVPLASIVYVISYSNVCVGEVVELYRLVHNANEIYCTFDDSTENHRSCWTLYPTPEEVRLPAKVDGLHANVTEFLEGPN